MSLKLHEKFKSNFGATREDKKRSVISRRFIIAISAIYSALIIATSVSFHVIMAGNAGILKDALISNSRDLYLGKIDILAERLKLRNATSIDAVKNELRDYNDSAGDILGVIIFSKTEDENYFRIADALLFHEDLDLAITRSEVVRELKDINYLKMGLLHSAVDPDIYSQSGYTWQNVYYPFEIKNKKAVIQFLVSAARLQATIDSYAASTGNTRIFNIIFTIVLIIAVIVLSVIFLQNYSLLISNLSSFMKKAADGDLDVSLNQTADDELNQLALSFNTLIDELKEKTVRVTPEPEPQPGQAEQAPEGQEEPGEKPQQAAEPPAENDSMGEIFTTGVSMLKDNRLEEAIAIFLTLTIMKPGGFGSYFNLGVAYAKKRDYDRAIAMFEEAARINPTFEVTARYIEKVKKLRDPDD
ncbi:MAG TPA: tetratricopeptide repeat protein [Spirochaetota bacterium]|nr:tetratricopeptide repeat protein [Spirochaetota bacterium]HRS78181.1 tetratricopeptide repeat protein [Spirochaetota bacterium]HRT74284.1 tetratricopeptide repeat protein [Spirochaetota bacterium]